MFRLLEHDFFSKFLMGGGLKIFGLHRSPTETKSDGGGGLEKKILPETKTAHLMQNWAIFCYFKNEIHLFKVLLSLKIVKFDTKMYLNFSNFQRRTSAGGGGKPWSKNEDKFWMGGLTKFSLDGGPPVPPGKKTLLVPCRDVQCLSKG